MMDDMLEKPAAGELSTAVLERDVEAVENLLELGADPNEIDKNGDTPLIYIVTACYQLDEAEDVLRITHLLVERGADPHKKNDDEWNAFDMRDEARGNMPPFWYPPSFNEMDVILSEAPERRRLYLEAKAREKAEIQAVITARENSHISSAESQLRLLARSGQTVVRRRPQP